MGLQKVRVIGAGPAGAAAGLAALQGGADVTLADLSAFPRHKVCGEFLSPEAAVVFERLGIHSAFTQLQPVAVRRVELVFGRRTKHWNLREPAFGVSRFALDHFLVEQARQQGGRVIRETASGSAEGSTVVAHGRKSKSARGGRLFGFKAHFAGPATDVLRLIFSGSLYIGMNSVENGSTNVCGIAPESTLREYGFDPDVLIERTPALREHTRHLSRTMDWLITGPLVLGINEARSEGSVFVAGDALGFVDPFTGSGMLAALSTGLLAGQAAVRGFTPEEHLVACRKVLSTQYHFSSVIRAVLEWGAGGTLASLLPGRYLFEMTRPRVRRMYF